MILDVEKGRKNEILRTPSRPVDRVTKDHKKFSLNMVQTMNAENGVGLAAPQAGRNIRMIVCKFNPGSSNELIMTLINPEIIDKSEVIEEGEEGCLSLPGEWGLVDRSKSVLVKFLNLKGKPQTLEFHDFNARIVQHEIDHLDGVLFVDRAKDMKVGSEHDKEAVEI